MSENKRKVAQLEKVIDAGHPQITNWVSVVKIDGQYYTPGLDSKNRRLLTDAELGDLHKPGVGVIAMNFVDAPIPEENKPKEVQDEEL